MYKYHSDKKVSALRDEFYYKGRADASKGRFNLPGFSGMFSTGMDRERASIIRPAYEEGHADKKREMDKT